MVPLTMIGRVIGIICSIAGIFFIAMIFVFLVLYTTLDEEEYAVSAYFYKYRFTSKLNMSIEIRIKMTHFINT